MNSINFNALIHSVTYYLSYQDKIGRSFMINESSLKYPVADYLTSLEISSSNIELEYLHPQLKQRYIDLITWDISKKEIKNVFEFKISKFATKNDIEKKRIFNDLMRLQLMGKLNNSKCYFLIAGTQSDFIQYFRSIVTQRPTENIKTLPDPLGFYTKWFKFYPGGEQIFEVKDATDIDYIDIYSAFIADYKAENKGAKIGLPNSIKTKCVAISALSRDFPTPYVGGIWEIE